MKSGTKSGSKLKSLASIALCLATVASIPTVPNQARADFWDSIFGSEPPPQPQRPQATGGFAPVDDSAPDDALARGEFEKQPRPSMPFYVTRVEWLPADEVNFAKFVSRLGAAIASKKCNTVKSCLQSPVANLYAQQDPPGLVLYSDCAEFPYLLRSYFAYHNGLPFSHVTDVKMNMKPVASINDKDDELATKHLDNDPYGNTIVARGAANLSPAPGSEPNFITYLIRTYFGISTRSFRVSPLTPNYNLSDVYPVKLNRDGIGPGTIVHTTGHVMVVWNVDDKGVIHTIDAHPDGSVQYKVVEPSTLERSRPDQGLGFFRFRPLHIANAIHYDNGVFYGGQIVTIDDETLYKAGKYSLEQWYGPGSDIQPGQTVDPNAWKSAFKGMNFFDYLAAQLRDANVIIKADDAVGDMMTGLCSQFQQRVNDVAAAVAQGVPMKPHPDSIPADVFGEEESLVWGPYATSGRDGRLKASVEDIIKSAVGQFRLAKSGDKNVHFDGSAQDYVNSLRAKLQAMDQSCVIRYANSKGAQVAIPFSKLLARLNRLSFDPYHCPEKRWGAPGAELATCQDSDAGNQWFSAEANLRNTVGKTNANETAVIRSNAPITLEMLRNPSLVDQPDSAPVNLGTATPPVMSLDANFASPKFIDLLTKP